MLTARTVIVALAALVCCTLAGQMESEGSWPPYTVEVMPHDGVGLVDANDFNHPSDPFRYTVELTDANYKDKLQNTNDAYFIFFYAGWCGHCKNLAPNWKFLAAAVAGSPNVTNLVIAKANAKEHQELANRFDANRFPTLIYVGARDPETGKRPKYEKYDDDRNLFTVGSFLRRKGHFITHTKVERSKMVTLDTVNWKRIIDDPKKDVLVVFFMYSCVHCVKNWKEYELIAKTFENDKDEIVIAMVDGETYFPIKEHYDSLVDGYPTLVYFAKDHKSGLAWGAIEGSERSAAFAVPYINKRTGLQRKIGGNLLDHVGTDAELDRLAKDFVRAAPESSARKQIKDEMATRIASLKTSNPTNVNYDMYVKGVRGVEKKGAATYARYEIRRLEMMKEKSAGNQRDGFDVKINVLRAFALPLNPLSDIPVLATGVTILLGALAKILNFL